MAATLLLVDDDRQNLELLEAVLEPLGHRLLQTQSGREAIEIISKERVDLLLLDVMMPGLSGFDVLAQLRALPTYRHVPVILITAAGDRERRIKGFQLGATEFVEKPVDQPILLARVRSLLQLQHVTDELIKRNEMLETMRQHQEETMHFIAHDLRNPLAVIRTNLEFLRSGADAPASEHREAIEDAERAVRRADGMIADLLTVARAEHATLAVDKTPVALSPIVQQVHHTFSPEAGWRQISFDCEVDPRVQLFADAELLRRVLENIVSNGLRHTPKGGRVEIRVIMGQSVELRIANSGPAIPKEERERVFEKFWRARGSPRGGSVGLGLYFCRLAVHAHGGRIWIEQAERWPTIFVISLPNYYGGVQIR